MERTRTQQSVQYRAARALSTPGGRVPSGCMFSMCWVIALGLSFAMAQSKPQPGTRQAVEGSRVRMVPRVDCVGAHDLGNGTNGSLARSPQPRRA